MKGYTDLEQSKKLAEILPLESADMFYRDNGIDVKLMWEHNAHNVKYPCWSLAALLNVLPDYSLQSNPNGTVFVVSDIKKPMMSDDYDNPVDACYEMILKLNELKLL